MLVVYRADNLDQLQPYRQRWDELAGECLFRQWTWLSTWWKHYHSEADSSSRLLARKRDLCVLLVVDTPDNRPKRASDPPKKWPLWNADDSPMGPIRPEAIRAIAPYYLERSISRGNLLGMMGDGEVCSDCLSLLLDEDSSPESISTLARSLCQHSCQWDLLKMSSIEARDRGIQALLYELQQQGCHVERDVAPSRWLLELPDCWDDFLAILSKSHRKKLRKLLRKTVEQGRIRWYLASIDPKATKETRPPVDHSTFCQALPAPLDRAREILIDLHQRRRQSLGEPGCFASDTYSKFHQEVMLHLLEDLVHYPVL